MAESRQPLGQALFCGSAPAPHMTADDHIGRMIDGQWMWNDLSDQENDAGTDPASQRDCRCQACTGSVEIGGNDVDERPHRSCGF